jgi:hypothetical protein
MEAEVLDNFQNLMSPGRYQVGIKLLWGTQAWRCRGTFNIQLFGFKSHIKEKKLQHSRAPSPALTQMLTNTM